MVRLGLRPIGHYRLLLSPKWRTSFDHGIRILPVIWSHARFATHEDRDMNFMRFMALHPNLMESKPSAGPRLKVHYGHG